jgi:hypothetical protein
MQNEKVKLIKTANFEFPLLQERGWGEVLLNRILY